MVTDPLVGSVINDRYRIAGKLADGGFGSIYRASQVTSGRKVAIKVMHRELTTDAQLVARFRREAVALCNLRDAHTVTTYELDETPDGLLYIVMELLEGRNLLEEFQAAGPLPWRRVFAIARAVCSALAEAHTLGIVHRDLKPANIFLEERRGGGDNVKVLDFGIAKIMQGSHIGDGGDLTVMGQAVGTLEYMAPEQLMGGKCDGRTDIYTLGVVAFELITGRRPFNAAGPVDLLSTQLAEKAPLPSLHAPLPAGVDRILLRCLERDQSERFADVGALAAALDELLAQSDVDLAPRTSTAKGVGALRTGPVRPSAPAIAPVVVAPPAVAPPAVAPPPPIAPPPAIASPAASPTASRLEAPPAGRLVGNTLLGPADVADTLRDNDGFREITPRPPTAAPLPSGGWSVARIALWAVAIAVAGFTLGVLLGEFVG